MTLTRIQGINPLFINKLSDEISNFFWFVNGYQVRTTGYHKIGFYIAAGAVVCRLYREYASH